MENNLDKLASFLALFFGVSPGKITPDARLVHDLYADSLQLLDLIMQVNALYQVELTAEDLLAIDTVGDLAARLAELGVK